jgi:isochorismate synthase
LPGFFCAYPVLYSSACGKPWLLYLLSGISAGYSAKLAIARICHQVATASPRGSFTILINYICTLNILADHINQFLSKCKKAQWAGVFYSLPFQSNFQFLLQDFQDNSPSLDHSFIFYPFNKTEIPQVILSPQFENQQAIDKLLNTNDHGGFWELDALKTEVSTSFDDYLGCFKKYKEYIEQGKCDKAILSTLTKHPMPTQLNVGELLFQLRKAYPQAFIYLFSSPFAGTWIGATPEILVNWEKNEVTTMSLAGTRAASNPEFNFGDKEKVEQEIVTNYIKNIFTENFGNANLDVPSEFSYGDMIHLITRISAKAPTPYNLNVLLKLTHDLHPTPAVGGFPKKPALELINQTETHQRFYYSGYLGPISKEGAALSVNLRCMSLTSQALYIYAGGGITHDSKLEAEWAESRLKSQALLKFL